MIIATMSKTDKPGTYLCRFEAFVARHRSPESRLARTLLAVGYDPTEPFATRWGDGPLSLKWPSLEAAGLYDVTEPPDEEHVSFRLRKWTPFPEERRP